MALEAIDLAEARAVPRDLFFAEKHAGAGNEDRLTAIAPIFHAQYMVDSVTAQWSVRERNEPRLVIASRVYWLGEVGVDGDDTIVCC